MILLMQSVTRLWKELNARLQVRLPYHRLLQPVNLRMVDDRMTKSTRPKGDSEEPGEIIKILKEKKRAPKEIEHWGVGMKGDEKTYLNDEACKIDKRGVPCKIGSDGRRILPSRRPIHKYTPEDWKKMGEAEAKAAYKKLKTNETKLDPPGGNGRKPRWERK